VRSVVEWCAMCGRMVSVGGRMGRRCVVEWGGDVWSNGAAMCGRMGRRKWVMKACVAGVLGVCVCVCVGAKGHRMVCEVWSNGVRIEFRLGIYVWSNGVRFEVLWGGEGAANGVAKGRC